MMRRGFTLLELMIASTLSVLVASAGFMALSGLQGVASRQQEAEEVVGAARLAMAVMSRDLRTAGDSLDLLPASCLGALAFSPTNFQCAAVLDAHPWRITIARDAWQDTDGDGSRFSSGDTPPPSTKGFFQDPANMVTFRFVPYPGYDTPQVLTGGEGGSRNALIGRIERVSNPFSLGGGAPVVSVLLENVLLDNRMRSNPANPTQVDSRYDYSLFMYQLLLRKGEVTGDASITGRETLVGDWFLTPPVRLFAPTMPTGYPHDAMNAFMSTGYTPQVVGLKADGTAVDVTSLVDGGLQDGASVDTTSFSPSVPTSILRYLLDRNRIRAVRVAFKVLAPERRDFHDGVDRDGDPTNGTSRVYSFETMVELKALSTIPTDA